MSDRRTNILLLYTDQQRFDTIAALGNPMIKTPVLDCLVREGTTFTSSITTTPVCIAARYALYTGRPAYRTGVVANMETPQDVPSLMDELSALGYQTHGVGKMHFHPDADKLWGFESRDTSGDGATRNDYHLYLADAGYGDVPHMLSGEYYYIPQLSPLPLQHHETHWIADRSIAFLERRDRSRPFFLWSSFSKPHPPFENPYPWALLYRGPEMARPFRPEGYEAALCYWNHIQNRYKFRDDGFDDHLLRTMRAAYYASISFIDFNVGRILAALGDELDNTLIVFTSDHGEMLGDFGSFGKRCMLAPSVRVPMIARWPGRFLSGAQCGIPTTNLDLWPTFLDAAGHPEPVVDAEGESLLDVARRAEFGAAAGMPPIHGRYVYSQQGQGAYGLYLITDGRWNYTYSAADEKEWVYDLATDPGETRNLAYNPLYQRQVHRLREALIGRLETADLSASGDNIAIEDGGWRRYGVQTLNPDPDYGLLIPHPEGLAQRIASLGEGYARDLFVPNEEAFRLLDQAAKYKPDPG